MKHTISVKKILSLFLSLVMLMSITAGLDLSAYAATTSGDFEYSRNNDEATITKYTGSAAVLTIPSDIDGYTVTSIGNVAFSACTALTSVNIPDSVTSIGMAAFSGCTCLTSVTIGNSVKSIGDAAFSACTALTSVNIPDSVTSIGYGAFSACAGLTSVNIPNSVTSIGMAAFSECTSLTNINVDSSNSNYTSQDGVLFNKNKTELIQYPAGNTRTTYTVPSSVTSIGYGAFSACTSLTSINVDNSNPNYTSQDGVLFNKNKTHLIQYPTGNTRTTYTIPNSVTSIDNGAFAYCTSLTSITIPDSVTSIGMVAFSECTSLTSVTIPDSVTSIGELAFSYCSGLTDVYYNATIAEWNNISIGDNNDNLINSTIYCSDGIINEKPHVHTWNDGETTKPATCTSTGTKTYTCVCGETKTETIAKNAHTYKEYVTKATTKKNGSIVTKCSVCGEVKSTSTIYYPKTITLSTASYVYNGKAKKPALTVKSSNGTTISASNYTVTYPSTRKNVGKYAITIKFKGNYSGSVTKYFIIQPKSTSLYLSAKSKGFTVKWNKLTTQTTGYQFQYSTYSNFKSPKTVAVTKNTATSKTIAKLKAKQKYYVRIRTYQIVKVNDKNIKIFSAWSKSKAVTTK